MYRNFKTMLSSGPARWISLCVTKPPHNADNACVCEQYPSNLRFELQTAVAVGDLIYLNLLLLRPARSLLASERLMCPVYNAFPTIIPAIGNWLSALTSSSDDTPPEAMIGVTTVATSSCKPRMFGPATYRPLICRYKLLRSVAAFPFLWQRQAPSTHRLKSTP